MNRQEADRWSAGLATTSTYIALIALIGAILAATTFAPEVCNVRGTGLSSRVVCERDTGAQVVVFLVVAMGAAFTLVPWFALSKVLAGIATLLPDVETTRADDLEGLDELPPPTSGTRPGWYSDPEDDTMERRWTGSQWSPDLRVRR